MFFKEYPFNDGVVEHYDIEREKELTIDDKIYMGHSHKTPEKLCKCEIGEIEITMSQRKGTFYKCPNCNLVVEDWHKLVPFHKANQKHRIYKGFNLHSKK